MYSVTTDLEKSILTIDISDEVLYDELRAIFATIAEKRREFTERHTVLVKLSNVSVDAFYFKEIDQQVLTGKVLNLRSAVIWLVKEERDTRSIAAELRKSYEANRVPCEIVRTQEEADVALEFIN